MNHGPELLPEVLSPASPPKRKKGSGDPSRFPTVGRPKGTKNKFNYAEVREAFIEAFEKTGGTKALVAWASTPRNKEAFYKMVVGLLPKNLDIVQHGAETFSVNIVHYDGGGNE